MSTGNRWVLFMMVVVGWGALLASGEPCSAQSGSGTSWDADGGIEADYRDVARLRWAGPGEPDTYEDYLRGRTSAPFSAVRVDLGRGGPAGGGVEKALVLVKSSLYTNIQSRLTQYVADLERHGYTVEVYQISGGDDQTLKQFILANSFDLVGCAFVGDLAAAWYESEVWGHEEYPCDLYFMDLDGTWTDTDGDGKHDGHSAGAGDEGPEIFVGRIDASMMSGSEVVITNAYFDKNHDYRHGVIQPPGYALSYTEDDWTVHMDIRTDIHYAYPDFEDVPAPYTNRDDYVDNRVPGTAYEFVQLACHSSPTLHAFTRGGYAYNSQIQNAPPYATFFNLFACSSLRFTSSNFLGGSYIYDAGPTSLAVIGSTKTGSMLTFWAFYQPFGNGECFGEAFRQWFNTLAPYNGDEIGWHFGMTIAGDPFLGILGFPLALEYPEGLPDAHQPPGADVSVTVEVRPGWEIYEPNTGFLHYRFDPGDSFTAVPFTALGGNLFEAAIPGPRPGDEPEFYLAVQGDHGSVVTSPADAPSSLHSFDVCFVDVLVHEDFEDSWGWGVQNVNLDYGAWERAVPNPCGDQQYSPLEDNPSGTGTYCFVTGNNPPGGGYMHYDIDGGPTRLVSPPFDLSDGVFDISAYNWYYSRDGNDPYTIDVSCDGGVTWTNVYWTYSSLDGWERIGFDPADHVTLTSMVQVRFSAQDQPDNDIVEAGVDDFEIKRLDYTPTLYADAYELSAAAGCNLDLTLDASPTHAGRGYLVAASLSGSSPGMYVSGLHVPLNWDAFSDLVYSNLSDPILQDFWGTLDGQGRATVDLDLPSPLLAPFAGETMTFAFVLLSPLDFASNAIDVDVGP